MATGVGERIKQRRNEIGITQDELARRMGLTSKSTVCKVETGKEDNLTLDRVAKYATALCCSPEYLMGWEEKRPDFSTENAVLLAELMHDAELLKNVKKLSKLSPAKRSAVYSVIDAL